MIKWGTKNVITKFFQNEIIIFLIMKKSSVQDLRGSSIKKPNFLRKNKLMKLFYFSPL